MDIFTFLAARSDLTNRFTDRLLDIFASNQTFWVIFLASLIASWFTSYMLKKRFEEYSHVRIPLTGKEVAERMLRENNIHNVEVLTTPGKLTDHYDPTKRTINLSPEVYNGANIAAAAVAAHECGHAVQHATAYSWLTMRSILAPLVSYSSKLTNIVLWVGLIILFAQGSTWVLGIGVVLLGIMALFAFITLPVEFDASRRALAWLGHSNVGSYMEQSKAKNALFWAAMTYVVAALAALAMFIRFLAIFLNNRR